MQTFLKDQLKEAFINLEWEDGYDRCLPPNMYIAGLKHQLNNHQCEVYATKLADEAIRVLQNINADNFSLTK